LEKQRAERETIAARSWSQRPKADDERDAVRTEAELNGAEVEALPGVLQL